MTNTTSINELAETRDLAATAYELQLGRTLTGDIFTGSGTITATITRKRNATFDVEVNGNVVHVEGVTNSGPRKVHGDRARTCERIEQAIEQAATA